MCISWRGQFVKVVVKMGENAPLSFVISRRLVRSSCQQETLCLTSLPSVVYYISSELFVNELVQAAKNTPQALFVLDLVCKE